ncbi:hypothetical protein [Limnochorda pilosa]|uniref:hypothetical protein n=1 Tax=Limnochorda pilosa TaxID=1555112 RepID=UPI001EC4F309|nr:hypothetical protein [Limnochorda pilosa]MBO2519394.1 hypothetical protein [Bacillota bacterium]
MREPGFGSRTEWRDLLDQLITLYAERLEIYRQALGVTWPEGELVDVEVLDQFEGQLRRQEKSLLQAEQVSRDARRLEERLARLWGVEVFTLRAGELPEAVVDQADDRLREARRLLRESQELARRLLEDVTQREARLREAMRRLLEEAGALQLERKAVGAYRVPKPKARFFDERR